MKGSFSSSRFKNVHDPKVKDKIKSFLSGQVVESAFVEDIIRARVNKNKKLERYSSKK